MLLAGAAFVAPTTGKPPAAKVSITPSAITRSAAQTAGVVTTHEEFRLSPASRYDDLIKEAADRYALPAALIRAVIRTESAFNPLAVSRAGAQGLMQLMPALSKEMGVADAFDPRENIMAGAQYLSALLGDQKGNVALALASYNAGPGAVERYHGIPPYKETQRYVKSILNLVALAESEETPD